jgi:hypothetical protein
MRRCATAAGAAAGFAGLRGLLRTAGGELRGLACSVHATDAPHRRRGGAAGAGGDAFGEAAQCRSCRWCRGWWRLRRRLRPMSALQLLACPRGSLASVAAMPHGRRAGQAATRG